MFRQPLFFGLMLILACQSEPNRQVVEEKPQEMAEQKAIPTPTPTASPVQAEQETEEETSAPNEAIATKEQPAEEIVTEAKPPPKPVAKPRLPQIKFDDPVFRFDTLVSGDKTNHKFAFTNTGKAPLDIKNVHVSCGCTLPSYPFIPIQPGEEGFIGVSYNSVGKEGFQQATIRVITNDPDQKEVVLTLQGVVIKESEVEPSDTTESK